MEAAGGLPPAKSFVEMNEKKGNTLMAALRPFFEELSLV
jgi:hypothetical protein